MVDGVVGEVGVVIVDDKCRPHRLSREREAEISALTAVWGLAPDICFSYYCLILFFIFKIEILFTMNSLLTSSLLH